MKPLGKDTGEMFQVDGVGTDFLDKSPGNKSKNRHRITSNQKFSTARQTINSDEAAYTGEETGELVTNKDLTSRVYTALNGAHAAAARC